MESEHSTEGIQMRDITSVVLFSQLAMKLLRANFSKELTSVFQIVLSTLS